MKSPDELHYIADVDLICLNFRQSQELFRESIDFILDKLRNEVASDDSKVIVVKECCASANVFLQDGIKAVLDTITEKQLTQFEKMINLRYVAENNDLLMPVAKLNQFFDLVFEAIRKKNLPNLAFLQNDTFDWETTMKVVASFYPDKWTSVHGGQSCLAPIRMKSSNEMTKLVFKMKGIKNSYSPDRERYIKLAMDNLRNDLEGVL